MEHRGSTCSGTFDKCLKREVERFFPGIHEQVTKLCFEGTLEVTRAFRLGRADHTSRHEWDATDGKAVDGWIQRKDGILKAIDDAKAHPIEASEIMAKYFEVIRRSTAPFSKGSHLPISNATASTSALGTTPGRSFKSLRAHLRSG